VGQYDDLPGRRGVWAAAVAIAFAKLRNGEFDRAAVDEEAPTASTEAGR
jgi:hypothetical protein